ncbi:MAG TPA: hypothetical protein VIN59_07495 [Alphaproteobacteria bacterium]
MANFQTMLETQAAKALGAELLFIAQQTYVQGVDGFYDVKLRTGYGQYAGKDLAKVFRANEGAVPPPTARDKKILRDAGFHTYELLAHGTTAVTFRMEHANGHHYALRIGYDGDALNRAVSPNVVQPFHRWESDIGIFEVLPMVQMLDLGDYETPQTQSQHGLYNHHKSVLYTAFDYAAKMMRQTNHAQLRDVGILPDGTPLQVDPGNIVFDRSYRDQTQVILRNYFYAMNNSGVPEALKWLSSDGAFKQDKFFVNPFDHPTHYQGLIPTP